MAVQQTQEVLPSDWVHPQQLHLSLSHQQMEPLPNNVRGMSA